jgi:hypothetical protein
MLSVVTIIDEDMISPTRASNANPVASNLFEEVMLESFRQPPIVSSSSATLQTSSSSRILHARASSRQADVD